MFVALALLAEAPDIGERALRVVLSHLSAMPASAFLPDIKLTQLGPMTLEATRLYAALLDLLARTEQAATVAMLASVSRACNEQAEASRMAALVRRIRSAKMEGVHNVFNVIEISELIHLRNVQVALTALFAPSVPLADAAAAAGEAGAYWHSLVVGAHGALLVIPSTFEELAIQSQAVARMTADMAAPDVVGAHLRWRGRLFIAKLVEKGVAVPAGWERD